MRIDFLARYRDVQRLVDAPARALVPRDRELTFEKTLGQQRSEPAKSIEESSLDSKRTGVVPYASLKSDLPPLKTPAFVPMEAQIEPVIQQSEERPSVKTPTVLEVRQVPLTNEQINKQSNGESNERIAVRSLVHQAGEAYGVDPALGMAIVKAESNFDTRAVSQDGFESKGLFQLLDSTGRTLVERKAGDLGSYDPFNPEMNVDLGMSYLKYLHGVFGTATQLGSNRVTTAATDSASLEKLAVAAFNAGEGRVASAQARALKAGRDPTQYDQVAAFLPASTQSYVEKVMTYRTQF